MISTAAIMISEKRLLTTEVRADHSASVPYLENSMLTSLVVPVVKRRPATGMAINGV